MLSRRNLGPNRPHDAHDAGSWAAAGHLNPNKTLEIQAVGSVCGCKYQCWCHLHCMTRFGANCPGQAL